MEKPTSLTIRDLCEEANRLLKELNLANGSDPDDRRQQQITPRTVHFYVAQGLVPRPDGRGPKARHPRESLYRILFIRRLRLQRPELSLDDVSRILPGIPVETLKRVALGREPLVIHQLPGAQSPKIKKEVPSRPLQSTNIPQQTQGERLERLRVGHRAELLVSGAITPEQRQRIIQTLIEIESTLARDRPETRPSST